MKKIVVLFYLIFISSLFCFSAEISEYDVGSNIKNLRIIQNEDTFVYFLQDGKINEIDDNESEICVSDKINLVSNDIFSEIYPFYLETVNILGIKNKGENKDIVLLKKKTECYEEMPLMQVGKIEDIREDVIQDTEYFSFIADGKLYILYIYEDYYLIDCLSNENEQINSYNIFNNYEELFIAYTYTLDLCNKMKVIKNHSDEDAALFELELKEPETISDFYLTEKENFIIYFENRIEPIFVNKKNENIYEITSDEYDENLVYKFYNPYNEEFPVKIFLDSEENKYKLIYRNLMKDLDCYIKKVFFIPVTDVNSLLLIKDENQVNHIYNISFDTEIIKEIFLPLENKSNFFSVLYEKQISLFFYDDNNIYKYEFDYENLNQINIYEQFSSSKNNLEFATTNYFNQNFTECLLLNNKYYFEGNNGVCLIIINQNEVIFENELEEYDYSVDDNNYTLVEYKKGKIILKRM